MNKNFINPLLKNLKENQISIFLFHGVIKKNNFSVRNYTNKHLNEKIFENIITNLKKKANPLSMNDILHVYEGREKIIGKNFAITFDDGFENNLSVAYPILKDNQIPMITYLTSDFINRNEMSWIDKIEQSIELTKKKEITLNNKTHKIKKREDKIIFLNFVRNFYKRNRNINLYNLASEIGVKTNVENVSNLKNELDLKINWKQIRKFKKEKYITFGGHSHTHQILSFLNNKDLEKEVRTCKRLLQLKGGVKNHHFSYPEGLRYCYSEKVIKVLKKFNYRCCPTAIKGNNTLKTNLFNLKRIMVQ